MGFIIRRFITFLVAAATVLCLFRPLVHREEETVFNVEASVRITHPVNWKDVPQRYPVTSMIPLPTGTPLPIPRIQHTFGTESARVAKKRKARLEAVKEAFLHSWEGYKKHAWLQDSVTPITGGFTNKWGKRGATLVDSLDTLLIMGLDEEFELAVKALDGIDFSTTDAPIMSVFETTIRYLGGLLSAYDLSEGKYDVLLKKAVTLGDMLYGAFDTPNRMPISLWDWQKYNHHFITVLIAFAN